MKQIIVYSVCIKNKPTPYFNIPNSINAGTMIPVFCDSHETFRIPLAQPTGGFFHTRQITLANTKTGSRTSVC
jgi:hypothetical protein